MSEFASRRVRRVLAAPPPPLRTRLTFDRARDARAAPEPLTGRQTFAHCFTAGLLLVAGAVVGRWALTSHRIWDYLLPSDWLRAVAVGGVFWGTAAGLLVSTFRPEWSRRLRCFAVDDSGDRAARALPREAYGLLRLHRRGRRAPSATPRAPDADDRWSR
jgi:hypothetical protein